MPRKPVPLAQLLTAAGKAMAAANDRLAQTGATAMIRDTHLSLQFNGQVEVREEGLILGRLAQPSLQTLALATRPGQVANSSLTVNLMAAPAVKAAASSQPSSP